LHRPKKSERQTIEAALKTTNIQRRTITMNRRLFSLFDPLSLFSLACANDTEGRTTAATSQAAIISDEQDTEKSEVVEDVHHALFLNLNEAAIANRTANRATFLLSLRNGYRFTDQQCVTVEDRNNDTIVYKLTNCSGPLGWLNINGEVSAVFSALSDEKTQGHTVALTGTLTATDKNGNRDTGTINYEGTLTAKKTSETNREYAWNANHSGTTLAGEAFTKKASFTTVYDAAKDCVLRNGTSDIAFRQDRGLEIQLDGYKRCGGHHVCPSAGTLSLTRKTTDQTISLRYLGSKDAEITGPRGRVFDVELGACTVKK